MMKRCAAALPLIAILLILSGIAAAQEGPCGAVPSLPTTAENTEQLKANLKGQADLLSKLVGKAELAGEIATTKKQIYQSSDKFFAAQKDAYLAYLFCVIIMQDKSLSTKDKLDALRQYKDAPAPTSSQKQGYDWRPDARRLVEIYGGGPFLELQMAEEQRKGQLKYGSRFLIPVGNYEDKAIKGDSHLTVINITPTTIGIRSTTFRKGVLHRDMIEEASIVDLDEYAARWSGTYDSLHLKCLAGECVRWTGWQWVSPSPGKSQRVEYDGKRGVIGYIVIPLVNSMTDALRLEMQQILARLISGDHTDAIVCRNQRC